MPDFLRDLDTANVLALILLGAILLALIYVTVQRTINGEGASGRRLPRTWMLTILALLVLFFVLLVLPGGAQTKGQLLTLIGIVLSAAVALSSTTFLGNAMAGIMLRTVENYKIGDFIEVDGHFGRVSEFGVLHTEIQTEERDLTTLPNLYLVTRPVRVVHATGTVLSAKVSLGYDVPRKRVSELLIQAAERAELEEPFVQVRDLGDFSITYRVAGIQREVRRLVSARSKLRAHMLDCLHEGGVEIVSPTFMNQRVVSGQAPVIPHVAPRSRAEQRAEQRKDGPEDLIFDKAEVATLLKEKQRKVAELHKTASELEKELAGDEPQNADSLQLRLDQARAEIETLEAEIEEQRADANEEHGSV